MPDANACEKCAILEDSIQMLVHFYTAMALLGYSLFSLVVVVVVVVIVFQLDHFPMTLYHYMQHVLSGAGNLHKVYQYV